MKCPNCLGYGTLQTTSIPEDKGPRCSRCGGSGQITEIVKQVRPSWCPHYNCKFIRAAQDCVCGGKLPIPTEHSSGGFTGVNTHRFCLKEGHESCYEVNANDLDWFRWIFDALDGKETSWLSIAS